MLADKKKRQRIAPDPQNQFWSKSKDKFGYKLLQKMGWEEGKGLGLNEDGSLHHLKVKIKKDQRGLGCVNDYDNTWIKHADGFDSLLKSLKVDQGTVEKTEKKKSRKEKKERKEGKDKKSKRKEKSKREEVAEEKSFEVSKHTKKEKKSKKEKHEKDSRKEKEKKEKKSGTSGLCSRMKHRNSKNVKSYSQSDLNAILGIKA